MRQLRTALVVGLAAVAGCKKPAHTDATETDSPAETDSPSETDADTDALPAGSFTVQVPSDAAPDGGIAVRVFHPAEGDARHAEGAPVAVMIPGSYHAGELAPELGPSGADALGLVVVQWLMPGGAGADAESGGRYDYRGPSCQQALADVLRYARGELADADGERLSDRVPFTAPDNVGIVADSNGANLALSALAVHDVAVEWLVANEAPLGDQYVLVELGGAAGVLNPFYVPGTCEVTTCPVPGMAEALAWDPAATAPMTDPATGQVVEQAGQLYLDLDGDGALTDADLHLRAVPGPGGTADAPAKGYVSLELVGLVDAESERLFTAWPAWLATPAETAAFWAVRDGSTAYTAVGEAHPELMVIALGSVRDHAQGQPDHPHLLSQLTGFRDAGTWFRLDPDAAYLAAVLGEPEDAFPDNPANRVPAYPGVLDWLLADRFDNRTVTAAMLELADRTRQGVRAEDLEGVLAD